MKRAEVLVINAKKCKWRKQNKWCDHRANLYFKEKKNPKRLNTYKKKCSPDYCPFVRIIWKGGKS